MDGKIRTALMDDNQTLKIWVEGRFDFQLHREFREAYRDVGSVKSVVVDLSQTLYLDSSALGMLLLLRESLGSAKITLSKINSKIRMVLTIAHFDRLFTFD